MLAILLPMACVFSAFAQPSDAYEMMVNGVKVIVQPSHNEIVEIQTVIKGGVQNYPANKEGIESLAMTALSECGTKNDSKDAFKNKLDKVSGSVSAVTGMDFAKITMNCIKSDFETVWPLYADAITMPLFDEKEFTRIKQDAINNLKAQASQPDYAIDKLAKQTAFAGKDYSKAPEGSEKTITPITAIEAKMYYHSILEKSRMFIVVVGDLDKALLEKYIGNMLASIPQGKPFTLKKMAYQPAKTSFIAQKKDLATNYIEGVTSGPTPGSPDYNAFQLAMRITYEKHFLEIRTKNGLSYAPATWFNGGASSSSSFFVSTTDPNKYITVLKAFLAKIKKEGFTQDDVKDMKTTYLTSTYYKQETNSAQASSFASNEALHNNWKRAITMNDDFKKVTVKDVNAAFNKYVNNMTWVYQGDPAKVTPNLYAPATLPDLPATKPVIKNTKN